MSTRNYIVLSQTIIVGMAMIAGAGSAAANDIVIPGIAPHHRVHRAGYRHAAFPPPQYNVLGMRTRTPQPGDRPSYREQAAAFPPPGGRYGGGFIEYVLTGGRPEPVAPVVVAAPVAPVVVASVSPRQSEREPYVIEAPATAPGAVQTAQRDTLPKGGLPDYLAIAGTSEAR